MLFLATYSITSLLVTDGLVLEQGSTEINEEGLHGAGCHHRRAAKGACVWVEKEGLSWRMGRRECDEAMGRYNGMEGGGDRGERVMGGTKGVMKEGAVGRKGGAGQEREGWTGSTNEKRGTRDREKIKGTV